MYRIAIAVSIYLEVLVVRAVCVQGRSAGKREQSQFLAAGRFVGFVGVASLLHCLCYLRFDQLRLLFCLFHLKPASWGGNGDG